MRCVSCGIDVPPLFVKAIETNVCPSCGEAILTDETKGLLTELSEAISKMPNDPQGLAGWLLSNYRIKKIGDAEPVERFYKKRGESDGQPLPSEHDFLSRTGMAGKVKNAKDAANKIKIKNNKFAHLEQAYNELEREDQDEDDFEDDIDSEDMEVYNQLKASGIDPFSESEGSGNGALTAQEIMSRQIMGSSSGSFDDFEDDGGEILTSDERALMQSKEGRRFVMENRRKRIESQNAFSEDRKIKFSR